MERGFSPLACGRNAASNKDKQNLQFLAISGCQALNIFITFINFLQTAVKKNLDGRSPTLALWQTMEVDMTDFHE